MLPKQKGISPAARALSLRQKNEEERWEVGGNVAVGMLPPEGVRHP